MSGFSSIANPGSIPTRFSNGDEFDPSSLFKSKKEKDEYAKLLSGGSSTSIKIKAVKVETFDLSDQKQVRKYERLWKSLLEKAGRNEVIVDSCKNLVQRADGTSYWLKYVEYVEFGEENNKEDK